MPKKDWIGDRISEELQKLLSLISEKCNSLGYKAYIVGGAVRDMLLGVELSDIDITVVGDAQRLAGAFNDCHGCVVKTYPSFKTVTLDTGGLGIIDIVTARREIYNYPAALPEVYPSSLYDDLYRRDFSINAMAVSLKNPQLIDYFDGYGDLCNRLIKVLHCNSFVDDPTRILRAIRLEKRYNFRMDNKTERLMMACIKEEYPRRLSNERILAELELILTEPQRTSMLSRMQEVGLWQMLFGGSSVPSSTCRKLDRILNGGRNVLLFSVLTLLEDIKEEKLLEVFSRYKTFYKKLERFRDRERSLGLEMKDKPLGRGLLYKMFAETDPEILKYLCAIAPTEHYKKNVRTYMQEIKDFMFYIDGNTLESFGVAPGPQYRVLLEGAKTQIVEDKITDIDGQLKLLKEMVQKGEYNVWELT